jgi:hypothetical protein
VGRSLAARVRAVLSPEEAVRLFKAMDYTPSGRYYGPRREEEIETVYRGISFVPPKAVREVAVKSLENRARGIAGGTDIGVGRAVQLALAPFVPPRDVLRMVDYFSRHRHDLDAAGARAGHVTPGVQAWMLWGGDPGKRWAEGVAAQMAKRDAARTNPRDVATKTDPALWRAIVADVTAGAKGGKAGQWSARKAQIAVALYKAAGGGYVGPKSPANSLARWTAERWTTKSGRPSLLTGERYLPEAAIAALTPQEYAATTRAKRAGLRRGEQFTPQPPAIAAKTRRHRK